MAQRSAGIILFRDHLAGLQVLLVHPGGPFWARKDDGAWSIPKGLCDPDEDPETAARREFGEEIGIVPAGDLIPLGEHRQPGGKIVVAFALAGDIDPGTIVSNTFEMEWPPRSGRRQAFPEVDRAAWFGPVAAREKLLTGQRPILERLLAALGPI